MLGRIMEMNVFLDTVFIFDSIRFFADNLLYFNSSLINIDFFC